MTPLPDLEAAYQRGRKDGIAAERKRLRPLLERLGSRITEAIAMVEPEPIGPQQCPGCGRVVSEGVKRISAAGVVHFCNDCGPPRMKLEDR